MMDFLIRRRLPTCAAAMLALTALLPAPSLRARNLDPQKAVTQYTSRIWRSEDGLPQDSVRAIVQTSDGYLWLGTQEGLARFDGERFTVFDTSNTPELPSNSINGLCQSRDQSLWAATPGGLIRYKDGEFRSFTTGQGLSSNVIQYIVCARDGGLWIGTGGGGINRFHTGRFEVVEPRPALTSPIIMWMDEDEAGDLWVGTQSGYLNVLRDGKVEAYGPGQGLSNDVVQSGLAAHDGNLWVGTRQGLFLLKEGRLKRIPIPGGEGANLINVVYQDSMGTLWLGTRQGLLRYRDGRFEAFDRSRGLCNDNVMSIYQDREGSLWIGTRDGLQRLMDGPVTSFTTLEGLSHDLAWTVLEGEDGSLWVATGGGGVSRIRPKGSIDRYDTRQGLGSNFVWTMMSDRQGRIWAGTSGHGIYRFEGGRFAAVHPEAFAGDQIWTMHQDKQGAIWVGTNGTGLKRLDSSGVHVFTTWDGLPSNQIWAILQDARGDLWFGTGGGGLVRLSGGHFEVFDHRRGLGNNQINALLEDSQGVLWAATNGGGISRVRQDGIDNLGAAQGLFSDVVFSILEDGQGNFWMSSTKGIFRLARQDLVDRMDGRRTDLPYSRFDKADGLKAYPYSGTVPAACRTRDGRLWFTTQKGVAVIDPQHIEINSLKPPVIIESLQAGGQSFDFDHSGKMRLDLPPGADDLEIRFTALSLREPGQVVFEHRLFPLEQQWTPPDGRRSAVYSRIPPGRYTFQVRAANEDGVWNEDGAAVQFQLFPYFYQTRTFYAVGALVLLLGLWWAYRSRFRILQRRNLVLKGEVDERRRAEEALRRSEKRFRGYFEMPLLGFAITSARQRFLEVNDKLCEILGYNRHEFGNLTWKALIHPEDSDCFERARLRFAEGLTDSHSSNLRCLRKDQQTIQACLTTACVRQPDGSIDHYVDVVQDLTEAKRLEQQLRDSRKMEAIGRLAGGVAHDFNNILTVISGYGQLLRTSVNGDQQLQRQVEAILDAAQKAENLTGQLLAFSRRQVLDPRILDLNRVISDTQDLLHSLLGEHTKLSLRLAADLNPVRVDAGQIQQVLMNLAVNSRDAMPDGGRFSVSTANLYLQQDQSHSSVRVPAGHYVLVKVSDTGRGMDAETLERAFEPFYTTKADGKGTGLGLATVYGIIKQSDGFVFIESQLGKGTTLRIYLPRVEGARPALIETAPSQEERSGEETILVVEDDAGIRSLIGAVLERSGYRFLGAENGTAALDLVDRHKGRIDLLLTDVVMPGMNGKELAKRLSASLPELPVIFMSGYTEDAIDRHGVLEPGTHFVQKPFTPTALAKRIREVLDAGG